MGMAASQTRYLSLVARKSNVEYEGQQINQARTALSNQSANLFNQMLTLSVPIPPSTQEFTTTQYSFTDGCNASTITEWRQLATADPEYNYVVTHHYYTDKYTGSMKKLNDPQVKRVTVEIPEDPPTTEDVYTYVGNCPLTRIEGKFEKTVDTGKVDAADNPIKDYTDEDKDKIAELNQIINDMLENKIDARILDSFQQDADGNLIKDEDGNYIYLGDKTLYTFTMNGTVYFTCKDDLDKSYNSVNDPNPNDPNSVDRQEKLAYYNASYVSTKVEKTEKAMLENDGDGRFTSVKFESDTNTYTLHVEEITDDNAYQDAMNRYYYDNAIYDKTIQDINAKTSIIQQEDQQLELRLKQLDTERNALTNEIEAVQKVVKDAVEAGFKTFGG